MTRRAPALLGLALAICGCRTSSPVTLRVLHVADIGDDTGQRSSVARAIADAHGRAPFDVAFEVGDNIYECGPDASLPGTDRCTFEADGATVAAPTPPSDPLFARGVESPLGPLAEGRRRARVYVALGNHDVAAWGICAPPSSRSAAEWSRTKACLEVAHRAAAWSMPGRHYVVDAGPARFIVIDSNLLKGDYGGFTIDGEVEFVRSATTECGARPCFLVSHHPPVTAGVHRDDATPEYLARVARVDEAAGGRIAAWLDGHDHDLQHLRTAAGTDVFVSGNTARGRPHERFEIVSVRGARLLFGTATWGIGILEVSAGGGWAYRFEDDRGNPLHCCRARSQGACEPTDCS